ncbi:hypothetical protein I3J13_20010 [Agrobacterium sp. MOPV5]|uniref:hypothetical protein n=1 Tax=Agrobacterium leguminum TaxID=2792015 RepID=UPI0018C309D1|nr:hypothetical protein [Agrobacterium leguminum]MBG0511069.1 hypothetical protein [Agrobacterium leguminum]
MTSLAAAIARDSRGPTALYLLTDSRITWIEHTERWDAGRKTFGSPVSADVFGYCGDAYFMPMALGQVLSMVACGVINLNTATSEERHSIVLNQLKNSLGRISTKYASNVTLFHGARDGEGMKSTFRLWRSVYRPAPKSWSDSELPVENRSYLAKIDGTGKATLQKFEAKMNETAASGTSRAAIHAFCKSLKSAEDPFSGGAPQMVGLWRIGSAKQFGYYWQGRFYIAGMECPNSAGRENIDWFNELFERCDPETGLRREGSANHKTSLKA